MGMKAPTSEVHGWFSASYARLLTWKDHGYEQVDHWEFGDHLPRVSFGAFHDAQMVLDWFHSWI